MKNLIIALIGVVMFFVLQVVAVIIGQGSVTETLFWTVTAISFVILLLSIIFFICWIIYLSRSRR